MAGIEDSINYLNNLKRMITEITSKVIRDVGVQIIDELLSETKEAFDETIREFYSDYPDAELHGYRRKHELYNLIILEKSINPATGFPRYHIEFDETKLHYRNGYNGEDGLYNTVFRMGYHGGSISHNPGFPGNGDKPYYKKYKANKNADDDAPDANWSGWSFPARKMDKAPLDTIKEKYAVILNNKNHKLEQAVYKELKKYGIS